MSMLKTDGSYTLLVHAQAFPGVRSEKQSSRSIRSHVGHPTSSADGPADISGQFFEPGARDLAQAGCSTTGWQVRQDEGFSWRAPKNGGSNRSGGCFFAAHGGKPRNTQKITDAVLSAHLASGAGRLSRDRVPGFRRQRSCRRSWSPTSIPSALAAIPAQGRQAPEQLVKIDFKVTLPQAEGATASVCPDK